MCTNLTSRIGYWSSELDSRHDCSSSIFCKCGRTVTLHMDELNMLRDLDVSMCDYTILLQRRDVLERGLLSIGRFVDPPAKTLYQLYMLGAACPEAKSYIRYSPSVLFLWCTVMLRREYG